MDHNHNNNRQGQDHDQPPPQQQDVGAGIGIGDGIGMGDIGAGIGFGIGFGRNDIGAGIGGAGLLQGLGLGGPPPPAAAAAGGLGLGGPPADGGGIGAGLAGLGAFGPPNHPNFGLGGGGMGGGVGQGFLTRHVQQRMPPNPAQTALKLSADERSCAVEIEQAVMASSQRKAAQEEDSTLPPPLTPLKALQYAQHALVAQGTGTAPVFHALQRIHGMQDFCQHYEIDDTVAQGLESIEALMEQQPGYVLEVECDPHTHKATLVLDRKAFYPSKALLPNKKKKGATADTPPTTATSKDLDHNWRVLVRGLYYLHRACQPNLAAVRHGLTMILDCEGMDFDQNVNEELDAQLYAELEAHLPVQYQTIQAYNTASVANVWLGLCKRFHTGSGSSNTGTDAPRIERRVVERVNHHNTNTTNDRTFYGALELGCKPVDVDASRAPRRMSETYLSAKGGGGDARALEALQTKVLKRARELLEQRDRHEAKFTLTTAVEDTDAVQQEAALPFGMAAAPW